MVQLVDSVILHVFFLVCFVRRGFKCFYIVDCCVPVFVDHFRSPSKFPWKTTRSRVWWEHFELCQGPKDEGGLECFLMLVIEGSHSSVIWQPFANNYFLCVFAPPSGETGVFLTSPSLHLFSYQTCRHNILNTNRFWCQLAHVAQWAVAWSDQLWGPGGQRSRSRSYQAEDRFGGLMKALFSTLPSVE